MGGINQETTGSGRDVLRSDTVRSHQGWAVILVDFFLAPQVCVSPPWLNRGGSFPPDLVGLVPYHLEFQRLGG